MSNRLSQIAGYTYIAICMVYVWMLMHYSLFMWETRKRYGIIFLSLTLILAALRAIQKTGWDQTKGRLKAGLNVLFIALAVIGGIYFWTEYNDLVWERAGAIDQTDLIISAVMIYIVVHITWATSGAVIPVVTMVFVSYALFGHLIPGFFHHSPIDFTRFVEFSAAEMDGIYGSLNQLGATYIAIFAFYAGFIQGFGGLDYVLRLAYQSVGRHKTGIPQVAVIASMVFGGMSGSAAANATGTGAFTIPTMKKFGLPPAMAAAVETIASSGGQIMPPILGATAFVMCDFLGKYYYEILFASIYASVLFFGSTMVSTHFLAKRYIDPDTEVDLPDGMKRKMTRTELWQGLPILFSMCVMLFAFIVYKINILLGGLTAVVSFLAARFIYEIIVNRARLSSISVFFKGLYKGTIAGASMMISLGAMLATLGIVVRVLIVTGLGEKISFTMVNAFGDTLWLFLILTMCVCIVFGMAVTTVGAYIMVVTLAAPALIKLGIDPMVAHFAVFYWAMLSAYTPPVAGVCVITAGIAEANFLRTCWESMKLGFPKFILPFFFVSYSSILSLSLEGFWAFLLASIGFIAISAGFQSGWGKWPQAVLLILGTAILIIPSGFAGWALALLTAVLVVLMWRRFGGKIKPAPALQTI